MTTPLADRRPTDTIEPGAAFETIARWRERRSINFVLQPRHWVIALFACAVVVSTLQRGVFDHSHTTFPIFRQSYYHLVAGRDLYAAYPAEQGAQPADRFKYSPTAAFLFSPFALPALPWGLFLWNAANAAILVFAVSRVLPRRQANWALVIIAPAALSALQSSSSNALMAGLLVLAWVALERGRPFGGAAAIAAGTFIKLFPLVGVAFAVGRPRPLRFVGQLVLSFAALAALPLLVTSPHELVAQYASWRAILMSDAADLTFGLSVMSVLRSAFRTEFANWPLQLAGTIALLLPLAMRWRRRRGLDDRFRRRLLCSVLVYAVLFNHQAEHQSFVIASVGLAVWYVTEPRTMWRTLLMLLCVAGLDTIPYLLVWITMQSDLFAAVAPQRASRRLVERGVLRLGRSATGTARGTARRHPADILVS